MTTHLTILHEHLTQAGMLRELTQIMCGYFADEICITVELLDALRDGNVEHLTWLLSLVDIHHEANEDRKTQVEEMVKREVRADTRYNFSDSLIKSVQERVNQALTHGRIRLNFQQVGENKGSPFYLQDEILAHALSVAPWQQIPKILEVLGRYNIDFHPNLERYRVKWSEEKFYRMLIEAKPQIAKLTPILYENTAEDGYETDLKYLALNTTHCPNLYSKAFRQYVDDPKVRATVRILCVTGQFNITKLEQVVSLIGMYHLGYDLEGQSVLNLIRRQGYGSCLMRQYDGVKGDVDDTCPNFRQPRQAYCHTGECKSRGMSRYDHEKFRDTEFKKLSLCKHAIPKHYVFAIGKVEYLMCDRTIIGLESPNFVRKTSSEAVEEIRGIAKSLYGPKAAFFNFFTVYDRMMKRLSA